jgi:hypothetical protein
MSNTYKSYCAKPLVIRRGPEYTGYLGESTWRSKAKRWFKRLLHKTERRYYRQELTLTLNTGE